MSSIHTFMLDWYFGNAEEFKLLKSNNLICKRLQISLNYSFNHLITLLSCLFIVCLQIVSQVTFLGF